MKQLFTGENEFKSQLNTFIETADSNVTICLPNWSIKYLTDQLICDLLKKCSKNNLFVKFFLNDFFWEQGKLPLTTNFIKTHGHLIKLFGMNDEHQRNSFFFMLCSSCAIQRKSEYPTFSLIDSEEPEMPILEQLAKELYSESFEAPPIATLGL